MLGKIPRWRHVVVLVTVLVCSVLAFAGIIGAGNRDERFDAKYVTVQPAGADGVRITEVVDEDFGAQDRHGYQRIIPNDFGVPTDITASSPDANADVTTSTQFGQTTIRLGDPAATISGQHRYVLAYTLPDARLSTGQLALDIIGTDETLETLRFTVVVDGMQLVDPTCNVGSFNTSGGCTLAPDGDDFRAVIAPLKAGEGITIGGDVVSVSSDPAAAPIPPLPARRADHRLLLGLVLIPIGLLAAGAVYVIVRREGRNEVAAGGAADAAYGVTGSTTTLVPDDRMAELASIEFVPPRGIEPWQGAVLLTERIDRGTVSAWFSGLIAREELTLDDSGPKPVLAWGPKADATHPATVAMLQPVMNGGAVTLGTYNPQFAGLWRQIQSGQVREIGASGWWRRHPPHGGGAMQPSNVFALVVVLFVFAGSGVVAGAKLLTSVPAAIALAVVLPALMALAMYWILLGSRSATGSGLAIRAESFRKFLAASEGKHVDWAWQQGLLREYSAWAVALGAADAWGRALAASNVPPNEVMISNPLLVYSMASAFASTTTAPQSSGGGGGGGGFSGGSVGGGGGGGSSGSW
ncbi:MAG: hypothetical protein JWM12_2340 [Ilumatobacteraceae bacterium]|nr:hypothetical protein [Ilumatobacteraceae bacterium]